jgi:hypothetical protein
VAGVGIELWLFRDLVTGTRALSRVSVAFSAAAFLSAAACGSAGGALMASTKSPTQSQTCPRLDSQLFQLTQSSAPEQFASGAGLDLNSSGVRVVIELAAGNDLPSGSRVTIEARYANWVQARVPVSDLCALASETSVVSVVTPARPVPLSSRP